MISAPARSYRHGNLPAALIAAARGLLDEGGPPAVGLRETARRVGVSATAAYRHFESKEALLAAVAAEGFRELAAALAEGSRASNPLSAMGRAYVEFGLSRRGAFRLMFSPMLATRDRFPPLKEAADDAFAQLTRGVATSGERAQVGGGGEAAIFAAWGLVHGLVHLVIDGVMSEDEARRLIPAILAPSGAPPTPPPAAAG